MYNITVMDQYSPAIVTVPADMSSVEISQFPYNGTSIVANREYNITVSAISDQGRSYPSDPVVICEFAYVCIYVRRTYTCTILSSITIMYIIKNLCVQFM